jgi:hypothetical protein
MSRFQGGKATFSSFNGIPGLFLARLRMGTFNRLLTFSGVTMGNILLQLVVTRKSVFGRWEKIATETHSAKLTGVAWSPDSNTLCLADDQGRILYWDNPTEKTASSKTKEGGMDVDRFFDDQAASTDGEYSAVIESR